MALSGVDGSNLSSQSPISDHTLYRSSVFIAKGGNGGMLVQGLKAFLIKSEMLSAPAFSLAP